MKKLLYVTLLSVSSIFAVSEMRYTVDIQVNGTRCHAEELSTCRSCESNSKQFLMHDGGLPYTALVTCKECDDNQVCYNIAFVHNDEIIAEGVVFAKVGQDAGITLNLPEGECTVNFCCCAESETGCDL